MLVQAEVSLYPIGQGDPLPAIMDFVARLEAAGLSVQPGPLSTLVSGESALLFPALGRAYEKAAAGRRVLVVKIHNAVPASP
jgi:uncharacterized protein YqgV (UPF0045/DUF77 family)